MTGPSVPGIGMVRNKTIQQMANQRKASELFIINKEEKSSYLRKFETKVFCPEEYHPRGIRHTESLTMRKATQCDNKNAEKQNQK